MPNFVYWPAAASVISARAAQTWNPKLVRTPRVLVPLTVEALAVRPGDAARTWAKPDGAPFEDQPARAAGVYLHWSLPTALRRADADGNLPPFPDRWLVLRLGGGAGFRQRAVSGWVLRAWDPTPTPIALDLFRETHPTATPMTASGVGRVDWSLYFDGVVNRLAFYDPVPATARGPLAYLVCGWYSRTTDDPLGNNIASLDGFDAAMAALGWQLAPQDLTEARSAAFELASLLQGTGLETPPPPPTVQFAPDGSYYSDGSWWPQQTLLHGSVVAIGWPEAGWELASDGLVGPLGGPPPATQVSVAVGSSIPEAVAAMLAHDAGAGNAAEARVLHLFQTGALAVLDQPDGRARSDAAFHAAGFAALSTGDDELPSTPAARAHTPTAAAAAPAAAPAPATRTLETSSGLHPELELSPTAARARLIAQAWPLPSVAQPVVATRRVPRPRLFRPLDPAVVVRGAVRSYQHDDGRFSDNGLLQCRLSGRLVTSLATTAPSGDRHTVLGRELVERGVENGSTPPECDELLAELALLDPGSAEAASLTALAAPDAPASSHPDAVMLARRFSAEQTAVFAARDPRASSIVAQWSGLAGNWPSPVAVSAPVLPWTPLVLEWSAEFLPVDAAEFRLDVVELLSRTAPDFSRPEVLTLSGRARLGAGGVVALGDAARRATDAGVAQAGAGPAATDGGTPSDAAHAFLADLGGASDLAAALGGQLDDPASLLANLDLLTGALEPLTTSLRGGLPSDGTTGGDPHPFFALRSGFLRFTRLRLVDVFGQVCELGDLDGGTRLVISPANVDPNAAPNAIALPPRFTSPARLLLEYDANPVGGFVLPNHLDGALELFAPDGASGGRLTVTADTLRWEAVDRATAVGERPTSATLLSGFVEGMLAAAAPDTPSAESTLSALLRAIDTTRWAVDPYARAAEAHLALLVSHPLVLLRARLTLDVHEPVHPEQLASLALPVRLGALEHWEDGLYGYFVGGDFRTLHCAPAVAAQAPGGAISHRYIDPSGLVWVRPGQAIDLVLLMEPYAMVHATSGVLPRNAVRMQREWLTTGLARVAASFSFGPLLVDPRQMRAPIARDLGVDWSWDSRVDATTWQSIPVAASSGDVRLSGDPVEVSDGWLRMVPRNAGQS